MYMYIHMHWKFRRVFRNIAMLKVDCFATLAFAVVFLKQRSHSDLDLNDAGAGTKGKPWKLAFAKKCGIDFGHVGVNIKIKVVLASILGKERKSDQISSDQEIGKFPWN